MFSLARTMERAESAAFRARIRSIIAEIDHGTTMRRPAGAIRPPAAFYSGKTRGTKSRRFA